MQNRESAARQQGVSYHDCLGQVYKLAFDNRIEPAQLQRPPGKFGRGRSPITELPI
jgi:hypothetical protein